jgi:hypothetical protein
VPRNGRRDIVALAAVIDQIDEWGETRVRNPLCGCLGLGPINFYWSSLHATCTNTTTD